MSNTDFEDDKKRKLKITDPYGNTSMINCSVCGATCAYSRSGECQGKVNMMSDVGLHLCEKHQHGAPNNWYESKDTNKDGPVQRMLGMQGDNVKELSNFGGEYKDEQDINKDYSKEDPRYTKG